ncbi:MAG: class I SAM-dependent methyltransferase [Oligoflexia bacterium]|nr:class I SAM-dependent methyltransferase [Oligoflexia bacterium]
MATTLTATNQEFKPKAWEEVACPLCGEKQSRVFEKFGYEHRYTYRRCTRCSLAFQNPRPVYDMEFVETAYEVYSDNTDAHWQKGGLTEKGKVVYAEYAQTLREIEALLGRKGRLLEVGCNTGFFLKVARDEGWSPVGVEISRSMAELAHRQFGVETLAGDWVTQEYGAPFDAAYCSHVIEHIPDPAAWMRRFREVLKPDGILCLSVPNMNSIDRRFKRLLKRLGLKRDKWQAWRTPDHLYEPCEKSMRPFFERAGFELLRTYTYPSEWLGEASFYHRVFHFWLRWGAKQRYYLRPRR